jgi:hypothetical protein
MVHFADDVARHFFVQNILFLAREYHIDAFRFDFTRPIHNQDDGNIRLRGSGGGWAFLCEMRRQVKAVDPGILLIAEELPNDWASLLIGRISAVRRTATVPLTRNGAIPSTIVSPTCSRVATSANCRTPLRHTATAGRTGSSTRSHTTRSAMWMVALRAAPVTEKAGKWIKSPVQEPFSPAVSQCSS